MNYLTKQFLAAVRICSGDSTIKQRLANAWMRHLDDIDVNDLPESQRQKFVQLREAMYERKPLPQESAPLASIRKMSARQAASHTNLIIAIYAGLLRTQSGAVAFAQESPDADVGSSLSINMNGHTSQRLN
jgi:hypothetical protein